MIWDRSNTLPMASNTCRACKGMGMVEQARTKDMLPCNCVLRAVFRACLERFTDCVNADPNTTANPVKMSNVYSRIPQEYVGDFYLTTKRVLNEREWKLINFHHLLGADWKMCCKKLKMDKGNFYHALYRIEAYLGRVYADMQPYGLFPLDQYFGGVVRPEGVKPSIPEDDAEGPLPLFPPLAEAEADDDAIAA